MTYRIDVLDKHPSQSAPYDTLEDALQAAVEYSAVWERDAGLTYHIYDEATGAYLARVRQQWYKRVWLESWRKCKFFFRF